jgi:uncharacterized membrane protein
MERRAQRLAIAALVGAFACLYAAEGLLRHWHFGSSFDLAIYDQAVWHLSHFERPASSIRGYANFFGDHFNPVFLLLAPLYWIVPSAGTLVVAQAVLFALSIVPVFVFLKGRLPVSTALALCVAYGLFWGLQRAAAFDVHEFAFAPLFIATAILLIDRRRWGWFWCVALLVALVKEDLVPVVSFFGVYLFATGERRRGAVLAVAAGVGFVFVVGFLIPWFAGAPQFGYTSAYGDAIARPWTIPAKLVSPPVKLGTAVMWLAPFGFLPLGSPLSMILVPLVLVRFLSSSPTHWGTSFHYGAPLAPILAMSAGDALARLRRWIDQPRTRTRVTTGLAWACVIIAAILPGHQEHWRLTRPSVYRFTAFDRTGNQAVALVPPAASVVAQAAILPHLSERQSAFVLTPEAPDGDFVVAAIDLSAWPLPDAAAIGRLIEERRARGYTTVFAQDGWTVLRR